MRDYNSSQYKNSIYIHPKRNTWKSRNSYKVILYDDFIKLKIIICYSTFVIFKLLNQLKMIFQIGWAALAAIFTFSIAMVVWGRNGDGSIDI